MYVEIHTLAFYAAIFFTVFGALLGLMGVWVRDFFENEIMLKLLITDAIFAVASIYVAAITKWLTAG